MLLSGLEARPWHPTSCHLHEPPPGGSHTAHLFFAEEVGRRCRGERSLLHLSSQAAEDAQRAGHDDPDRDRADGLGGV